MINTHIQATVRECCVIIGGRNNKLKDQKVLDQKGSGRQRNPPKEILHGLKGPFQKHMAEQKFIYVK